MATNYWEKIAILDVTTWVGTSAFGASHYYGRIRLKDKSIDVTKPIKTKKLCDKLNKEDRYDFDLYEVGDNTNRFHDIMDLIKHAKKVYKKEFPEAIALIRGDYACVDPQEILCAPKKIEKQAKKLYEKFESYDGWNCSEDEEPLVQGICDKWDNLWTNYLNKEVKK